MVLNTGLLQIEGPVGKLNKEKYLSAKLSVLDMLCIANKKSSMKDMELGKGPKENEIIHCKPRTNIQNIIASTYIELAR